MTTSVDALRRANLEALDALSARRNQLFNVKVDALEAALAGRLDRARGLSAYDAVADATRALKEETAVREELQDALRERDPARREARVAAAVERLDELRRRGRDAYYRNGAKIGDPCIPCLQKAILDAEAKRLRRIPGMTEKRVQQAVKKLKRRLQYADPEALMEVNKRLGTRVNFGALARFEGGQWTRGYVPPAGRSGVTIGTGFDVGQWRASDLRRKLDLPESLASRLEVYTGRIRGDAVAQLQRAPLEITREEANVIDRQVHQYFVQETMARWDAARGPGTPAYRDLSEAQQTVLFSRSYHQGIGMPNTAVAQDFYRAAQRNDWAAAERNLRNYPVRPRWYRERVGAEANLLRDERARGG